MQFRNIVITTPRNMSVKDNQLIIDENQDIKFPLEDINCVMVESRGVTFSASMLSKFAENSIALYVCDEKHMPNAVLLPMSRHSRHFKMLTAQIETAKPLNKQLWQKIVKQKIKNQALCLQYMNNAEYKVLEKMTTEVKSGDTGHVEAKAAAFYFRQLFGDTFTRADECTVNAALNYGYAIIRGLISRTIVVYGFEPTLGIWHKSELNSFNLADDLIEPYRPLVDLWVAQHFDACEMQDLCPDDKRQLVNLINYDMDIDGMKRILTNCIDMMVSSYHTALMDHNADKLIVPELLNGIEHRYE